MSGLENSYLFSTKYPHACFYVADMYCDKSLSNLEIRNTIIQMLVWLQDNKIEYTWSDEETELTDLNSIAHVIAGLIDKPTTNKFSVAILFADDSDMMAFVLRFGISTKYAKKGYCFDPKI